MKSWNKYSGLFTALVLLTPAVCFAQYRPVEPARGCAACGCCGTFIFVPIVLLVISIALLIWVARDAKARGMDDAVLWMLLVFFLNLIGLVIYLFSRPQGNLVPCPNCGNMRLLASVRCPHCGIGS
jgi:uncharacterized membrane protein YhaH (DUF805 family)